MFKTFCLPQFLSSLMLKNCLGSLRNENSFCLLLTWLIAQLMYTLCVIRIQGEKTALLPSSWSQRRVTSGVTRLPGHGQHLGTQATVTQQAINNGPGHRNFSLSFYLPTLYSILGFNSLHCLYLFLFMRLIHSSTHSFILSQKCVEYSPCAHSVHYARCIEDSRWGKWAMFLPLWILEFIWEADIINLNMNNSKLAKGHKGKIHRVTKVFDGKMKEGGPFIRFLKSCWSYFSAQKLSSDYPLTKALFLKYLHGSRYRVWLWPFNCYKNNVLP